MSIKTLFNLCLCLVLAACAPEPTSEEAGTEADGPTVVESNDDEVTEMEEYDCEEAAVLCVDLMVPADYAGNPRNLFVGLYDSLPPIGPPTVFLFDEDAPDFTPGEAIEMSLREDVPESGEYYLFSVLYDQAGGEWMPEPGIDYVATSTEPYSFDGQGKDIGEVPFSLYDGE